MVWALLSFRLCRFLQRLLDCPLSLFFLNCYLLLSLGIYFFPIRCVLSIIIYAQLFYLLLFVINSFLISLLFYLIIIQKRLTLLKNLISANCILFRSLCVGIQVRFHMVMLMLPLPCTY